MSSNFDILNATNIQQKLSNIYFSRQFYYSNFLFSDFISNILFSRILSAILLDDSNDEKIVKYFTNIDTVLILSYELLRNFVRSNLIWIVIFFLLIDSALDWIPFGVKSIEKV